MDLITAGRVLHLGTYNGNPLVMAAAKATLAEACDRRATDAAIARNDALVAACQAVIDDAGLPAHTVQLRRQGLRHVAPRARCATTATTRRPDFDLAFAQWIHGINRGMLLPPGLDEQWLISVMHDDADGDALRRRLRRVRRRADRLTLHLARSSTPTALRLRIRSRTSSGSSRPSKSRSHRCGSITG